MTIVVEGGSPDLAPSQSAPAPQEHLVAGRFRLIEQLGRGGMGRVYRAHDEVLDRPVAVKLIYDDAVRDREHRNACALEARAAARLNHPGIVRILDSGFDNGHCYVVMSLVNGRPLNEILREDGALPVDRALHLAIQVADALAAAHQDGVIHCDVKPGNLLVDADWRVRLVDFGIARVTSSTTGLTGELLQGSAQYVAPEQVEGASVDGRTDLYALGTVLYEMLAGNTPFGGGTIASILARRLVNDPPSIRETNPVVPPKVDQVVLKALARDPEQRFQTAADFRDALMEIRQAVPMLLAPERDRAPWRSLQTLPGLGWTGLTFPRPIWGTSRQAVLAGTAQAADWTARTGRRAREVAGTALPEAMTRAHLLTPTRRPTLRSGVGLAVVVGLLVGATAAKCGVADVSADSALASAPAAITVQQPAPAAPTLVPTPVEAAPPAESVVPAATEPPPPTPVPPTATQPAPTATSEPAVAEEAPAAPPPPPAQPRAPVRAQSVPPPAPTPASEPAPAPPPPAAEVEKDEDDKPRNNLSNMPRSDEKTPEERAKADAKKDEEEKRADPPKPARPATLAPYIEPSRQQAPAPKPQPAIVPPRPEPPKPQPQKQEVKQPGGDEKEKEKKKEKD